MKIFVDDIRLPPEGYVLARTVDIAIELLRNNNVEFASLDHDMGKFQKDGSYLIGFIKEHNLWPKNGIHVHSRYIPGKEGMDNVIKKFYGRTFNVPI